MVPQRSPATAWSPPPYCELHPLPRPGVPRRETLPRAAVLVLDAAPGADAPAALADVVRGVRARFPAAPVVVRVPVL
ncbi:MAG TPA: hypothetical protein VFZ20_12330, partial [Longimicrobium sp.]